jgi:hypothetical protein
MPIGIVTIDFTRYQVDIDSKDKGAIEKILILYVVTSPFQQLL